MLLKVFEVLSLPQHPSNIAYGGMGLGIRNLLSLNNWELLVGTKLMENYRI